MYKDANTFQLLLQKILKIAARYLTNRNAKCNIIMDITILEERFAIIERDLLHLLFQDFRSLALSQPFSQAHRGKSRQVLRAKTIILPFTPSDPDLRWRSLTCPIPIDGTTYRRLRKGYFATIYIDNRILARNRHRTSNSWTDHSIHFSPKMNRS